MDRVGLHADAVWTCSQLEYHAAHRERGLTVRHPDTVFRNGIEIGCTDLSAKTAKVGVSQI